MQHALDMDVWHQVQGTDLFCFYQHNRTLDVKYQVQYAEQYRAGTLHLIPLHVALLQWQRMSQHCSCRR
jgi:hypothetical protein